MMLQRIRKQTVLTPPKMKDIELNCFAWRLSIQYVLDRANVNAVAFGGRQEMWAL